MAGGRHRGLAPAIGLMFLSTWVGEFLLGSSPIQHLPAALVLLVPLYGGGALLIREIARRRGLGHSAIVLLGAAYGVIEAGLLDQSMFNPAFRDEGGDPGFGTLANDALGYVVGHAIWSISIPIAMTELLAPDRSAEPWLGRKGLAATVLLYLAGCAMVFSFIYAEYKFLASPMQLAGAAAAAALLAALAFAAGAEAGAADGSASSGASQPVGESPETSGRAPGSGSGVRPWLTGIGAFAVSSAFVARPEHGWVGLAAGCFLIAAAWILVRRWSRSPWWSVRHRLALVSGTLLTYAWLGFYVTYLLWPDDRIAWFGNGLFALTAVALAALMARRARAHAGGGNH